MRGLLIDLDEPAKGSRAPGDAGGVMAVRPGEEGGEESTAASDGEDEGERR